MRLQFTLSHLSILLLPVLASCGDVAAPSDEPGLGGTPPGGTPDNGAAGGGATGGGAAGGGAVGVPGGPGNMDQGAMGPTFTGDVQERPAPGSPGAEACIEVSVQFEKVIPNVLLLVDMSGSMTQNLGGEDTPVVEERRWGVLHDALMNTTDGVVFGLQNEVNFGLMTYTTQQPREVGCPALQTVPIALSNHAAIAAEYNAIYPLNYTNGETPTPDAVDAAAALLASNQGVNPNVLVIATDGEPDTCEVFNDDLEGARAASVVAVQNAYMLGITSFVVSVGRDVAEQHLQELANAGQGLAPATPGNLFYTATTRSELASAFQQIVGGVASCTVDLNGEVTAGLENTGTVSVNGAPQVLNDPNGWRLVSPSQIELLGTSCAAISEQGLLEIRFPCESFDIR